MLLYAWSGERAAAVRQYQVCTDILVRELDVPPLPETTELFQAIKEQREPASPPLAVVPPPEVSVQEANTPKLEEAKPASVESVTPDLRPLIGRDTELNRLLELHRTAREQGRLVVLQGEAGIGKTSLATHFLARVQGKGALTVVAHGYEGEQ